MARPNRNRDTLVAFFVTKEEREQMKKLAQAHDMTFSEYARRVLLGKIKNSYGREQ